jgi:hypothetical protein
VHRFPLKFILLGNGLYAIIAALASACETKAALSAVRRHVHSPAWPVSGCFGVPARTLDISPRYPPQSVMQWTPEATALKEGGGGRSGCDTDRSSPN